MLRYHVTFLIDSAGCDLFRKLCPPYQTVHHSLPECESAITSEIIVTHMNFQIVAAEQPWPTVIQLTTKSGATCLSDKSAECERFEAVSD